MYDSRMLEPSLGVFIHAMYLDVCETPVTQGLNPLMRAFFFLAKNI